MRKSIQHRFITCTCIAALMIAQGCASGTPEWLRAPTSKNLRSQYGTLGVASVDVEPGIQFSIYDVSSDTGRAGVNPKTYGDILRGGANSGGAGILLVPAFLAVVGIVDIGKRAANAIASGTVVPVADPVREKKIEEIKASFRQFVAEHDPNASLRQRVVSLATTSAPEKTIDAGTVAQPGLDGRPPPALAVEGAQTILKITSFDVDFKVDSGKDPDLSLSMRATARLFPSEDDHTIWYIYPSTSPSTEHKYSQFMARDAALLKSTWNKQLDELSQKINAELKSRDADPLSQT